MYLRTVRVPRIFQCTSAQPDTAAGQDKDDTVGTTNNTGVYEQCQHFSSAAAGAVLATNRPFTSRSMSAINWHILTRTVVVHLWIADL